ncbi:MAG: AbrB/MazE/SpoVT family DNA-binding domain-containing protein [Thermofilum sp.]|jgi:AbrB family looped-hinge helix DNA binding protein|nr:AbrB/MazE/SpoVT family DNA-binding domain-containing protein [Thermofilum sp.]
MLSRGRRGARGLSITSLPYKVKVYSNNQVLIPAQLVRALGIQNLEYAEIVLRRGEQTVNFLVRLLKTRFTDSRQFTIPKEIRDRLNILPGMEIEILEIKRPREIP